jgi:dTMP kinase
VLGEHGPDLTLLLDAPVEVGLARIGNREHDHFEREQIDFFTRVRDTYLSIAAAEPERVKVIDAHRGLDAVEAQIRSVLECFMADFGGTGV